MQALQRFAESGNPACLYVVHRLLHLDGFGLYDHGNNGNRVHVRRTGPGNECGGSKNNGVSDAYFRPGIFRSVRHSSIPAAQELGLGVWACAHLPRADQRLLFTRMYSSTDLLVETRDEGLLW